MTVAIDKIYFTSFVNLATLPRNGRQDYANAWNVIQALCGGYGREVPDHDAICNIISANAAAGWVGMDQEEAAEIINGYGMTELAYLGNKDYRYRFMDFVYKEFLASSPGNSLE